MQITIPLTNVGKLTKQLERLAARAVKLGMSPVTWSLGDVVTDRGQLCQAVTIDNRPPELPGYKLIATLTFETGRVGTREDHAGASQAREMLRDGAPSEIAEDLLLQANGVTGNEAAAADVEAAMGGDEVPALVQGVRNLVTNLVAETCRPTVRTVPGETLPDRYLDAKPVCNHCGFIRRRKEAIVIQHTETGEHKQVGTTCLGAFFDESLAAMLRVYASTFDVVGEDVKRLPPKHFTIETRAFVTLAAAQVRIHGYRRRQTGHDVWAALVAGDAIDTTPEDAATADAAIAWTKEIVPRGDWQRNIRAIAESPVVSRKRATLAASMVVGYHRSVREAAETVTPAPEGTVRIIMHEANPKRLRNGTWGAWVQADDVQRGDAIRITTRAGRTWADEVLQVIWQGRDGAIVATVNG